MSGRRRALVLVPALVVFVSSAAIAAQTGRPASAPLRHQIDATCNGFATAAKDVRTYHLTRYSTAGHAKSGWLASDPKRDEALQNSPSFLAGDFVTIVARGATILTTMLASTDSTGDGGTAYGYCFIDGTLARGTAEVADVSDEMAWTHTAYYQGGKPIADSILSRDLARKRAGHAPSPPNAALQIPAASTPQKLPYYGAFAATLAGKLPKTR
jgi:hypothetical protein